MNGRRRVSYWKLLIRARALENQAYVIGANRVGESSVVAEGFAGESIIASPWGTVVTKLSDSLEEVRFVRLNLTFLRRVRREFPVLQDLRAKDYGGWYLSVSQPPPQH